MDLSPLTRALDATAVSSVLAAAAVFVCSVANAGPAALTVTSPAFADGGLIPVKYTCDGRDISPELRFSGVPAGAASLAILCDDPDAPVGDWVHWLVFNIPPGAQTLAEGVSLGDLHAEGATPGANGWGKLTYGGPCPPGGTHRYFFKVYALSGKLDLPAGANKARFLEAIRGHVLAEGHLMGRYARL
jgi:hypothetical protein